MAPDSHNVAHDRIMGGLIRRGLSSSANGAENCPDPEIAAAYYERSLDANERAQFETHLSICARCREQVAALVRANEQPVPMERRLWYWNWRLITAAVAALLVLTIWGVRWSPLSSVNSRSGDHPLVATSRPPQEEMRAAAPQFAPAERAPAAEPEQVSPQSTQKAPEAAARLVPKAQLGRQNETGVSGNLQSLPRDLKDLPVNGRNFQQLDQLQPSKPSMGPSELKKEAQDDQSAIAPAVTSTPPKTMMIAPAARSLPVPTENQSAGRSAPADENLNANPSATDTTQAKQLEQRLGSLAAGSVAQIPEQRAGATIIPTPDPKIMWRIVSGRFVERTEDGGATWHGQVPASDVQLTAGAAPNSKTCWLVGRSGAIVVTIDALHWEKVPPPIPADFVAIVATNNKSATVTAADGQKFSTENEGRKWVLAK